MNLLPSLSARSLPMPALITTPADARHRIQHCVDRAYRETVEERPTAEVLRNLCHGLADAFSSPLVALVRRHESGTLEIEAASRETLLWAELTRLPERCDGTIAGNGPASRALRTRDAIGMGVGEDGFMPWREAASRDGIASVWAHPLETEEPGWVLMLCASRTSSGATGGGDEAGFAATACARLLDAIARMAKRRLLASALSHAGSAAFIADVEGRIAWCNAAFCRLTGYSREDVLGRNPRFLGSGRHGVRHYRDLWNTIRSGDVWRGVTVDRDRSGIAFTANQTISPFGADGRVTHYLALYDDISQQQAEEMRRELTAPHDSLTGLMHRAALEQNIADRLSQGRPVAIGVIASRRLAAIEGLGPDALQAFFAELQSRLREAVGAEHAARMSAGEYLVDLPEDGPAANRLVETLMQNLSEPYPLIGEISGIDLRIGRARAPDDGVSVDALLRAADRALGSDPMMPAHRRLERGSD